MSGEHEHEQEHEENSAGENSGMPQELAHTRLLRVPALLVIALYMFLIAGTTVVRVAKGLESPLNLILSAVFFTAALGLLFLFRWAWTLTLAAVVLRSGLFFFQFSAQHDMTSIVLGGVSLIIFLYLVRPEVRANLR